MDPILQILAPLFIGLLIPLVTAVILWLRFKSDTVNVNPRTLLDMQTMLATGQEHMVLLQAQIDSLRHEISFEKKERAASEQRLLDGICQLVKQFEALGIVPVWKPD